MFKRTLFCVVAASLFLPCQSVFGQIPDLFVSFGQGVNVSNIDTAIVGETGTAFFFARNGFDILALDLQITSSDSSVLEIDGGRIFNSEVLNGAFTRFPEDGVGATLEADGAFRFFAIGVGNFGIISALADNDEDFDEAADAFLIGEIDYRVLGTGSASLDIDFFVSESGVANGVLLGDGTFVSPTAVGGPTNIDLLSLEGSSATLTVVPEPSSAALLALGFAGLYTRRRKNRCQ